MREKRERERERERERDVLLWCVEAGSARGIPPWRQTRTSPHSTTTMPYTPLLPSDPQQTQQEEQEEEEETTSIMNVS